MSKNGYTGILNTVIFDANLTHFEFRVYCVLCSFAFQKKSGVWRRVVWPSTATIAKLANGSRRGVIQVLQHLEDKAYIEIEHSHGGPSRATNSYRLLHVPGREPTMEDRKIVAFPGVQPVHG